MLRHGRLPPRVMDEPTFMMLFDLELERARRHERAFGLTRFEVDPIATRGTEAVSRAVTQVRTCDVATLVDEHLIVLWSESLPTEMSAAIERIVRTGAGSLKLVNSVAFPTTALTRAALLGQLLGPPPASALPPSSADLDAEAAQAGSDQLVG